MALKPRQKIRAASELATEIELSRREFEDGVRQIKASTDIRTRFARSFSRNPAIWSGGFILTGLLLLIITSALLTANRKSNRKTALTDSSANHATKLAKKQPKPLIAQLFRWALGLVGRAILNAATRVVIKQVTSNFAPSARQNATRRDATHSPAADMLQQLAEGIFANMRISSRHE